MSVDKLVDSTQLDSDLTSVADAIRTKGGTSAALAFPADFVSAIAAIPSGGSGFKYETGSFTLATDTVDGKTTVGNGIPHGLGIAPDVVIIWQETYKDSNVPTVQVNAGYVYLKRIMDIKQRLSSSASSANSFFAYSTIAANSTVGAAFTSPSSTSYMPSSSNEPSSTEFYLYKFGNQAYWRSGVSYKYFVSEKWWT